MTTNIPCAECQYRGEQLERNMFFGESEVYCMIRQGWVSSLGTCEHAKPTKQEE